MTTFNPLSSSPSFSFIDPQVDHKRQLEETQLYDTTSYSDSGPELTLKRHKIDHEISQVASPIFSTLQPTQPYPSSTLLIIPAISTPLMTESVHSSSSLSISSTSSLSSSTSPLSYISPPILFKPKKLAKQKIKEGTEHFRNKKYENAIDSYSRAIEYDDKNFEALHYRGYTLSKIQKYDLALRDLKLASKLCPTNSTILLKIINVYIYQEMYRKALNIINTLLESGDDPIYMAKQSEIYYRMGKHKIAFKIADNTLKINPLNINALMTRASIFKERGQLDESLTDISLILHQNPQDLRSLIVKGKILYKKNDYDGALSCFSASLKIQVTIDALTCKAEIFYQLDHFKNSLHYCNIILNKNPKDIPILLMRGNIFRKMKEFSKAFKDIETILFHDPTCILTLKCLANTYIETKNFIQAEEIFTQIIFLNPNDLDLLYLKGNFFFRKNNFPSALEFLNKVIMKDSKHYDALILRGIIHYLEGRVIEGFKDMYEVFQIKPYNREILGLMGKIFCVNKMLVEANQLLTLAIKHYPDDSFALKYLGWTMAHSEDLSGALLKLNQALEINPKDSTAYKFRAEINRRLNNFDEALSDILDAVTLDPSDILPLKTEVEILKCQGNYLKLVETLKFIKSKDRTVAPKWEIYVELFQIYHKKKIPKQVEGTLFFEFKNLLKKDIFLSFAAIPDVLSEILTPPPHAPESKSLLIKTLIDTRDTQGKGLSWDDDDLTIKTFDIIEHAEEREEKEERKTQAL